MSQVACESKLRSVIRSSIHPCQCNWVGIGHTVVKYAQAAHAFSAGIKCWDCMFAQNFHFFVRRVICIVHEAKLMDFNPSKDIWKSCKGFVVSQFVLRYCFPAP